jgi:hypothetical protein
MARDTRTVLVQRGDELLALLGSGQNSDGTVFGHAVGTPVASWTDSVANLGGAATFNGTGRDLLGAAPGVGILDGYTRFRAFAFADVAGTLFIDFSTDNATFRVANGGGQAVAAGQGQVVDLPVVTRYARVRYLNGAGAQAAFLLASMAVMVS